MEHFHISKRISSAGETAVLESQHEGEEHPFASLGKKIAADIIDEIGEDGQEFDVTIGGMKTDPEDPFVDELAVRVAVVPSIPEQDESE